MFQPFNRSDSIVEDDAEKELADEIEYLEEQNAELRRKLRKETEKLKIEHDKELFEVRSEIDKVTRELAEVLEQRSIGGNKIESSTKTAHQECKNRIATLTEELQVADLTLAEAKLKIADESTKCSFYGIKYKQLVKRWDRLKSRYPDIASRAEECDSPDLVSLPASPSLQAF